MGKRIGERLALKAESFFTQKRLNRLMLVLFILFAARFRLAHPNPPPHPLKEIVIRDLYDANASQIVSEDISANTLPGREKPRSYQIRQFAIQILSFGSSEFVTDINQKVEDWQNSETAHKAFIQHRDRIKNSLEVVVVVDGVEVRKIDVDLKAVTIDVEKRLAASNLIDEYYVDCSTTSLINRFCHAAFRQENFVLYVEIGFQSRDITDSNKFLKVLDQLPTRVQSHIEGEPIFD